jgi:RimJ/RimL family protein N-acetyltransferase
VPFLARASAVAFAIVAVYETERLIVRPWTHDESDVDRIFDTYSRWEVARWLGATPRALTAREEADAAVDRWAGRASEDGRFGVWAIQVRETDAVAGTVLLVNLPESAEIEVGWHLHPDSWGHGYATEAARAVIERGFAAGVPEVYAVVRPGNEASMAVCRRLGMAPLGRLRRWYDVELEAFRLMAPVVVE